MPTAVLQSFSRDRTKITPTSVTATVTQDGTRSTADVDDDEWVLLVRCRSEDMRWSTSTGGGDSIRLERIPNRIGMCPIVLGGRYGLSKPMGQFDQLVGKSLPKCAVHDAHQAAPALETELEK